MGSTFLLEDVHAKHFLDLYFTAKFIASLQFSEEKYFKSEFTNKLKLANFPVRLVPLLRSPGLFQLYTNAPGSRQQYLHMADFSKQSENFSRKM